MLRAEDAEHTPEFPIENAPGDADDAMQALDNYFYKWVPKVISDSSVEAG